MVETGEIPEIFNESQKTATAHRKLSVKLRKLLFQSINSKKGFSLEAFSTTFVSCVSRILAVKKKEIQVERCVKFISSFVSILQEKTPDESEASIANEFSRSFLDHLVNGLEAKDKIVRFRSCQILACCIDNIEEMDDDIYEKLKDNLIKRCRDKEASIRAQAVVALSKFQVDEEDEENEDPVGQAMLFALRHDPSANVRRASLNNLEITRKTVPFIVERIRDVDPVIRKFVYSNSLKDIGDFRIFSIADRELIIRWGLKDRDIAVQSACLKMLTTVWIPQCNENVVEFLNRLDVVNSELVEDCLLRIFKFWEDNDLDFDSSLAKFKDLISDDFWENLTPETSVLMHSFFKFNREEKNNDELLPEITFVAKHLQSYFNKSIACVEVELKVQYDYICRQLLKVCLILDFTDEVGRQNMHKLLMSCLVKNIMDENQEEIFDLLQKLSYNSNDFARSVMEIVAELQELIDDCKDTDLDELSRDIKSLSIHDEDFKFNIICRCLVYVKLLLQRIQMNIQDEPLLLRFLLEVVVPGLQGENSQVQISSLECMLQYCLLDKNFASQNLEFIVNTLTNIVPEIRQNTLKVIFDIVLIHGFDVFQSSSVSKSKFISILTDILDDEEDVELKTVAIEGSSKLYMFREFENKSIMSRMIEDYFSGDPNAQAFMIQQLSFFFPVFCNRSKQNKYFFAMCFANTFLALMSEEIEISPAQIIGQVLEWIQVDDDEENDDIREDILFSNVAIVIIRAITGHVSATVKHGLQFLNKMYIEKVIPSDKMDELSEVAQELSQEITDKTSANLLDKFMARFIEESEDETTQIEG